MGPFPGTQSIEQSFEHLHYNPTPDALVKGTPRTPPRDNQQKR